MHGMEPANNRKTTGGGVFVRGRSGNLWGRPAGALNRLVEHPKYRAAVKRKLLAGTLSEKLEILLWHFAYGRPAQQIEVSGGFDHAQYLAAKTPDQEAS